MENALKYSSESSAVKVSCIRENSNAVIAVTNEGKGIADSDVPYIFERFYRADTVRTPGESGRGLGLSIVKQIVELHGGSVWFSSKPEGETTFYISLPVKNGRIV